MGSFIDPSPDTLSNALDGWRWLDIADKAPVLVTAFGDVFFEGKDGIWFLDTLDRKLKRVCDTRDDLHQLLRTEHGEDHYLFAPFVQRAEAEGHALGPDECYDFKVHPVVGGAVDMSNVEKRSFLVSLHLRGQLHEQVRHLPPGTKINSFTLVEDAPGKRKWWKLW
jgi:Domain of unknown function (DUF1851)